MSETTHVLVMTDDEFKELIAILDFSMEELTDKETWDWMAFLEREKAFAVRARKMRALIDGPRFGRSENRDTSFGEETPGSVCSPE